MNNADFKAWLKTHGACKEGFQWVGDRDAETAWRECPRGDWLTWWAQIAGVPQTTLTIAAARFARLALPYAGELRYVCLAAIEAAEWWAVNPTAENDAVRASAIDAAIASVIDAAIDAARASAIDAASAAARAAAIDAARAAARAAAIDAARAAARAAAIDAARAAAWDAVLQSCADEARLVFDFAEILKRMKGNCE